jgi:hypothetical protein
LHKKTEYVDKLLAFVKEDKAKELENYTGNDVSYILDILKHQKHGGEDNLERNTRHTDFFDPIVKTHATQIGGTSRERSGHHVITTPENRTFNDTSNRRTKVDYHVQDLLSQSDSSNSEHAQTRDARDTGGAETRTNRPKDVTGSVAPHGEDNHNHHVTEDEHDTLHEVAHGLHFASIAILGFLVLEVSKFITIL